MTIAGDDANWLLAADAGCLLLVAGCERQAADDDNDHDDDGDYGDLDEDAEVTTKQQAADENNDHDDGWAVSKKFVPSELRPS